MNRTLLAATFVLLGMGCGSSSGGSESASSSSTEASTSGSEASTSTTAAPRATGQWIVAGEAFTPAVALAYTGSDGTYEVRLASPAIDCEFARNGGVPPDGLRMIHVHSLTWTPGASTPSSGGDFVGQVAFDDGSSQFLGNGSTTFGAVPTAESVGTLTFAAGDGETPPRHDAHGEIDVTLCP